MDRFAEQARELAAKRVERRAFLKGALGVGVLAALESSNMARALIPALGGAPDPHNSGLDTIVCTMMENRSLDHYLGWMGPAIDGIQGGYSNPKELDVAEGCPGGTADAPTVHAVKDATPVNTYRLDTHCLGSDPNHGWDGSRVCFNGGAMDGFAHQNGVDGMGYYTAEDIPFLAWLATNNVTFSRYFSSVMGPTFPNRRYWISANGGARDPSRSDTKGNDIPAPNGKDPEPDGHDWPSIFHQLDAAGIPWTYYHSDLATVMLFFNRVTANPGKVRFIADYFVDAAAGLLTPVVFVDPSFYVWGNDDHPAHDVMWGQRYLYDTFLALAQGPQWWNPKTKKGAAFILNYDEAGGFYDHVPPPRVYDPDANPDHCEDWARLGFRVPAVVASPFTIRGPGGGGMVAQNLFDHTSVVKFLQWRFDLGSLANFNGPGVLNLGSRDLAPEIHNLTEVFDFDPDRAHPEFATEPPQIPLHAQGLACAPSPIPEANGGQNPIEDVPDVPLPPLARPRTPANTGYAGPHADWVDLADRGFFGRFDFRERAKAGVFRD